MIESKDIGKLIIDGRERPLKYDRNLDYGFDGVGVTFYNILKRIVLGKLVITFSLKNKQMKHSKDFTSLAFDPPKVEK